MNLDMWRQKMKGLLDGELFEHSREVAYAAAYLAKRYGADRKKACLAGLVHDYAKRHSCDQLKLLAVEHKIKCDPVSFKEPRLLHAPVGAVLLQREFALDDEEILRAVRRHTTGCRGMGLLDKVVYLADSIEAGRDYPGVEEIRGLALKDLDAALLAAVDQAIGSVLQRGLLLHPDSVDFRNWLLGC